MSRKYDVNGCILIIIAYAVKIFMHIQADKNVSPGIICALRTKSEMLDHFNAISRAAAISKANQQWLKTKYGLENQPSPLLKLSFDVYK